MSHTTSPQRFSTPPLRQRRVWPWVLLGCSGGELLFVLFFFVALPLAAEMFFSASLSVPTHGTPVTASGTGTSAEQTGTDFLTHLQEGQPGQANDELDARILVTLSKVDFIQQAQQADRCAGPINSFHEVSHKSVPQGTQFLYQVARKTLAHTYQLTLTLQQAPDGGWTLTDYRSEQSQDLTLVPASACQ